jgi:threonine dehydratase
MPVTLEDVHAAARTIAGSVIRTPCLHSRTLSEITGAQIFLKFENRQFTASFKERGALNKLLALDSRARSKGVIAVSAGNHAQGVAYHARRLGIPSVIVMPRFTPHIKLQHTRNFGAEVLLHGDNFDEAKGYALEVMKERGLTLVHPYDDERVIAGQGTVALEMLEDQPELDIIVVPVGGGGLIAGMAVAAKGVRPSIEVLGVQTRRFPSMYCALKGETPVFGTSTIAEGIAVKGPGALTLSIVRRLVGELMLVEEGEIEEALLLLLEVEKTVVEGAGAASLAAVIKQRERFAGRRVGLVLSGGNIDPPMLADIFERGMVRSGRLTRLRVQLRDLPGSLAAVTRVLADNDANIEEVHHQRAFTRLPVEIAEVDFVLETRDMDHVQQVLNALNAAGYKAKLHND